MSLGSEEERSLPRSQRRNSRPCGDERLSGAPESSFATELSPLLHAAEYLYKIHARFEWRDLVERAGGPRLLPPDANGTSGAALEEVARRAHEDWDRAAANVETVLRETREREHARIRRIGELEMQIRGGRAAADDAPSRRLAREHDETAEKDQAENRRLRAEAVADGAAVARAQGDAAKAEERANRERARWLWWLAYAAFAEASLSARQANRGAETARRRAGELTDKAGRMRSEAGAMA